MQSKTLAMIKALLGLLMVAAMIFRFVQALRIGTMCPLGSMIPDRRSDGIAVDKLAYDSKTPFTATALTLFGV